MFTKFLKLNLLSDFIDATILARIQCQTALEYIGIPVDKDICDVIYETGPYCGTNIIGPDQTPHIMRGV